MFVEPRSVSFNVFPPKKWSVSLSDFPPKMWLNSHQKKRANIRDRLISCENVKNWMKMILAALHCARATTTTTAQVNVGE